MALYNFWGIWERLKIERRPVKNRYNEKETPTPAFVEKEDR